MPSESKIEPEDWVSPSLRSAQANLPAFEMKFVVDSSGAAALEAWAARHLTLDPHADPALDNRYRITTLYFDTPTFDVARRTAGYERDKHRIRRYGNDCLIHLERKTKSDGTSTKFRTTLSDANLDEPPAAWAPAWFLAETTERNLAPTALITYERTAFLGVAASGSIRLTFDRNACGIAAGGYRCDPPNAGTPLLGDRVIVEMKYLDVLPALFKDGIAAHRLVPAGLSKYRRFAAAAGLLPAADLTMDSEEGTDTDARLARCDRIDEG